MGYPDGGCRAVGQSALFELDQADTRFLSISVVKDDLFAPRVRC